MTTDARPRTGLKPILWFLFLTFGITYAVEIALITLGMSFESATLRSTPAAWLLVVMWVPGLSAIAVEAVCNRGGIRAVAQELMLRIGPLLPYLATLLLMPIAYGAMYGLTWLAGLSAPDLTMHTLVQLTGTDTPLDMDTIFSFMLPMSALAGPFLNLLFGLGEEIGWRGFLLPRLMFLGKAWAYPLLGILWGLWHAPLIWAGLNYTGYPLAGMGMMCLLCFAFGLLLNELTLYARSAILAGFIHAAANAQGYGIWPWLFPNTNPLLGGSTGLTAVAIWIIAGLITMRYLQNTSVPSANE